MRTRKKRRVMVLKGLEKRKAKVFKQNIGENQ
jgi:hypothetical protein